MNPTAAHGWHQGLVDELLRDGALRSPTVEAAFRAVPRHLFLPGLPLEVVYRDNAIVTKREDGRNVSSSSQPAIMAIMLEQLDLRPGHQVLEIGAGTGCNAAIMAHIVGESGKVTTIDIDQDIVFAARRHLAAAGFDRVQVVCGDGGLGYALAAPYDRIILTVGAWDIVPAWRDQLKPGGRLVLPLSLRGVQVSVAFDRIADHLSSTSAVGCGFMPLRGPFAGPPASIQILSEPGVYATFEDASAVDPVVIHQLLVGSVRDRETGVRARPREVGVGLSLWLATREPGFCSLVAEGGARPQAFDPLLVFDAGRSSSTVGILEGDGLAILTRTAEASARALSSSDAFGLRVHGFGPNEAVAARLVSQVQAWDAGGRPSADQVRVRAYPVETDYTPDPEDIVISKRWSHLVLDWRG